MQTTDGDFTADSSFIELLSWEQPEKVRAAGRELQREHFPWDGFSGPWDIHHDKAYWDGIAEALCEMDDETLAPHLTQVLVWAQDLNWPGARQIERRLRQFEDKRSLAEAIESALQTARDQDDSQWEEGLEYLFEQTNCRSRVMLNRECPL